MYFFFLQKYNCTFQCGIYIVTMATIDENHSNPDLVIIWQKSLFLERKYFKKLFGVGWGVISTGPSCCHCLAPSGEGMEGEEGREERRKEGRNRGKEIERGRER